MTAALTVRRARAIGACASRGEVERWLGGVPVEQLGLAADEILYVPRLRARVPAPGGHKWFADRILDVLRTELARADIGWGERFVPGRAYRFRSRPVYCAWLIGLMIRDVSTESRAAFAAMTGEFSLARWQRKAVLGDGPLLVATVARLAEIGCAASWIATFDAGDIALATRSIAAAFGVRLDPAVAALPSRSSHLADTASPGVRRARTAIEAARQYLAMQGNDWRELPPPLRALLLTTTTLALAPSQSADQAAALADAILAHTAPTASTAPSASGMAISAGRSTAVTPMAAGLQPPARPALDALPAPAAETPVAHRPPLRAEKAREAGAVVSPPDQSKRKLTPPTMRSDPAAHSLPTATALPHTAPSTSPPPPARSIAPSLMPDAMFGTEYGGLLFLLNAFTALGLYPDFTQPHGTRLDPSPLWLADRIGRYWFGARYVSDPLARWCAAHAAGGALPPDWRIQRDWLDGMGTARAPGIVRRRNRVTLWHPNGFPLHDAARYRPPPRARPLARAPRRLPRVRSDRWAACLALYLEARLRRMAGAGLDLLALPARIRLYDLDLSATFDLARHPIELRLAGLDRNPGWQPAEGRSIAFAFA